MAIEHIRDILGRLPGILRGMYESPAEESLGERSRSAIDPSAKFETQIWVDTSAGAFRLDLLLTDKKGRRIAIEVDGKAFHEPVRDHWRTVFVIGDGKADVVYRVQARDLRRNLIGVLAGLATVEPSCFCQEERDRWREIANGCAIDLVQDWDQSDDEGDDMDGRWLYGNPGHVTAIEFRGDARDCSWAVIRPYYEFAVATGLKDLGDIDQAWKCAHPAEPLATSLDSSNGQECFCE